MDYKDICKSNQALFGELELLTLEIAYCKMKNIEDEFIKLSSRKEAVQELININLESMDEYWRIMDSNARETRRIINAEQIIGRENRIVNMFVQNPELSIEDIAHKLRISVVRTSQIVTQYITNKYTEVA